MNLGQSRRRGHETWAISATAPKAGCTRRTTATTASHWHDDYGCPIWFLHELHVGDAAWQPTLNRLIPIKDKVFNGQCYTFTNRERGGQAPEAPLRPGQQKGLQEWLQTPKREAPG